MTTTAQKQEQEQENEQHQEYPGCPAGGARTTDGGVVEVTRILSQLLF